MKRQTAAVLIGIGLAFGAAEGLAAEAGCSLGIASLQPPLTRIAVWDRSVPAGHLRLSFRGHATFLIETPGGASAVTDYNGVNRPPYLPDAVTMNRAHTTHYSDFVEPEIPYVLPGWDRDGGIAHHEVAFKDLSIFNVPTNLYRRADGALSNENSIFVFKAANLCVAHLGHLHHVLTPEQRRRIRRVDVMFVNIDNNTLTHSEVIQVIEQIAPRLVIPMHYVFRGVAEAFAAVASRHYPVRSVGDSTILVGETSLPNQTEVLFLQPAM